MANGKNDGKGEQAKTTTKSDPMREAIQMIADAVGKPANGDAGGHYGLAERVRAKLAE